MWGCTYDALELVEYGSASATNLFAQPVENKFVLTLTDTDGDLIEFHKSRQLPMIRIPTSSSSILSGANSDFIMV